MTPPPYGGVVYECLMWQQPSCLCHPSSFKRIPQTGYRKETIAELVNCELSEGTVCKSNWKPAVRAVLVFTYIYYFSGSMLCKKKRQQRDDRKLGKGDAFCAFKLSSPKICLEAYGHLQERLLVWRFDWSSSWSLNQWKIGSAAVPKCSNYSKA